MRIVSFTLPHYMHPEYTEDPACPVWQALQTCEHYLADDGETIEVTERMGADDPRAVAFRGHPAEEHDHSHEYVQYTTDSPARCDGFGTIDLGVTAGWRRVAIRREHEAWQLARYGVAIEVMGAERAEEAA